MVDGARPTSPESDNLLQVQRWTLRGAEGHSSKLTPCSYAFRGAMMYGRGPQRLHLAAIITTPAVCISRFCNVASLLSPTWSNLPASLLDRLAKIFASI